MSRLQMLLAHRLGLPGVVGLGIAAACAAFHFSALAPAREEALELRRQMAELGRERTGTQWPGARPSGDAAQVLERFPGYFLTPEEAHGAIATVFGAAAAEGLRLDTGEYRLGSDAPAGLARYQMVFPLKGGYPQLRRFVARALEEVPGLALEDVSLRRERANETAVEARVQFALYIGQGRQ